MKGNLWLCSLWGHVEMERRRNREIVSNPFSTEFNIHNGIFSTSAITRPGRWLSKFAFTVGGFIIEKKSRFMGALCFRAASTQPFIVHFRRLTKRCNFWWLELWQIPFQFALRLFQPNKSKRTGRALLLSRIQSSCSRSIQSSLHPRRYLCAKPFDTSQFKWNISFPSVLLVSPCSLWSGCRWQL